MNLEQLQAFVALAEFEGLGRASTHVHRSPSSLSRTITSLERELGTELFVRSRTGLRLTARGKDLLEPARSVLRTYEGFVDLARSMTAPRARGLMVAVSPVVPAPLVDRSLHRLRAASSGREITLRPETLTTVDIVARIADKRVDLGLVHLPVTSPHIRSLELLRYDMVVATHQGHPLATQERLHLSDLTGERVAVCWHADNPAMFGTHRDRLESEGIKVTMVNEGDLLQVVYLIKYAGHIGLVRHPKYGGAGALFLDDDIALVATADPVLANFRLGLAWHGDSLLERELATAMAELSAELRAI